MDPAGVTQLGVSGVVVVILLGFIKVLWERYQAVLKQLHDDQAQMLPVLEETKDALRAALEESIRTRTLAEREGQQ